MATTTERRINPGDVAHRAVHARRQGVTVTPATIRADLIAEGATPAQAATVTRIATALIPTVTARSLATWLKVNQ